MKRHLAAVIVMTLALTACTENTVLLRYRFVAGRQAKYRWSINATTTIDSPSEKTTQRIGIVVNLTERVQHGDGGNKVLRLQLLPVRITEDGRPAPKPPVINIAYEVGPQGQVTKLLTSDLPAGVASSLELDTLASETRPPLSRKAVAVGDGWAAPLAITSPKTTIDLKGTGRLLGFDLIDKRKLARIETKRTGEIDSRQTIGDAPLTLKGTTRNQATSAVDIDNGILFSSNYRSFSDFRLSLAGTPAGKLKIVLRSKLQLIG